MRWIMFSLFVGILSLGYGTVGTNYDIIVAGAGTGGTAAAIEAARMGESVLLVEETDWIGGQMNAAAVTSMDGGFEPLSDSGIYREFSERVERHYKALHLTCRTAYYFGNICVEPRVGQRILYDLIDTARAAATLDVSLRTTVVRVIRNGDTVTGAVLRIGDAERTVTCRVLIDATEWGDVIPLAGARYRIGNCMSDALVPERGIQFLTWTAVVRKYPKDVPPELRITTPPPGYEREKPGFIRTLVSGDTVQANPFDAKTKPWTFATFIGYRGMPDSGIGKNAPPITRTHLNWNNDFPVFVGDVEDPAKRRTLLRSAQIRTLNLLYYIQTELGKSDWSVADDEGYDTPYRRAEVDAWLSEAPDLLPYREILYRFPVMAYARESRRIVGVHTLAAREVTRYQRPATQFASAVALGDYFMDLHGSLKKELMEFDIDRPEDMKEEFRHGKGVFTVPFESFIPETIDGFIAAEKNISQSRLVNGATRLQPSTMLMGQAAGAIAALSVRHRVPARRLDPVLVQERLLSQKVTLINTALKDMLPGCREWNAVQLAIMYGLVTPENGSFRPDAALSSAHGASMFSKLSADAGAPDPLTRGSFAASLARIAAPSRVTIDFAASSAESAQDITRSEAAQVAAEYLILRATAAVTGKPQTLSWRTVRPATPPPPYDASGTLYRDCTRLAERSVIDAADYWLSNAVKDRFIDGEKIGMLMERGAKLIDPASADSPPVTLLRLGIISKLDTWQKYGTKGERCPGDTAAILINRLARRLP